MESIINKTQMQFNALPYHKQCYNHTWDKQCNHSTQRYKHTPNQSVYYLCKYTLISVYKPHQNEVLHISVYMLTWNNILSRKFRKDGFLK